MLQTTHSLCIVMSHVVLFVQWRSEATTSGRCVTFYRRIAFYWLIYRPLSCSFNHFFCFTLVLPTNPPKLGGVAPPPRPPLATPLVFAYRKKLNISTRELQKFYQRSYIVNLSDFCNVIKKILDKIFCHRYFYRNLTFTYEKNHLALDYR